jgi:endogenous inhibitor of DNA gyrase (YacG/DUF329 family)
MIYSIRVLCPNRHLIASSVFEESENASRKTLLSYSESVAAMLAEQIVNKERPACCERCQSDLDTWKYHVDTAPFEQLEDALPTAEHFLIPNDECAPPELAPAAEWRVKYAPPADTPHTPRLKPTLVPFPDSKSGAGAESKPGQSAGRVRRP